MMVVSEQQTISTYKQRPTQIPVAKFSSRGRTASASSSEESMAYSGEQLTGGTSPWRQRYDHAETKRKETLSNLLKGMYNSECVSKKKNKERKKPKHWHISSWQNLIGKIKVQDDGVCQAMRDKDEFEKSLIRQKDEIQALKSDLEKQKQESDKLRSLSEGMVKEYDQLKNKYELETGALQQAMQRATEWYKENRELKRKSAVLVQKVMSVAPSAALDQTDHQYDAKQTDEIDLLNHQIQELRSQVAGLQAEVSALKLQEFEAQEQVVDLITCLDEERSKKHQLQQELKEEKAKNNNLDQATRLAAQEVSALRHQYEKEKNQSIRLKSDADQARKERNVLAHQSQILLCDAAQDERLMKALFEIENLKRLLEDEQLKNSELTHKYQEKLSMEEEAPQVELLEEKLKLIQSELTISEDKSRRADEEISRLQNKIGELEDRCRAPPPPPPPPPPPSLVPAEPSIHLKVCRHSTPLSKSNSVVEMANLLGVPRAAKPTIQQGAIEELINEIKGGRFSLRTPERQHKKTEVNEQPPALKEMMNVLGTLRRRPGNRVPSFKRTKTPEMKQATQDITI